MIILTKSKTARSVYSQFLGGNGGRVSGKGKALYYNFAEEYCVNWLTEYDL
jgi:hypothetical protein